MVRRYLLSVGRGSDPKAMTANFIVPKTADEAERLVGTTVPLLYVQGSKVTGIWLQGAGLVTTR